MSSGYAVRSQTAGGDGDVSLAGHASIGTGFCLQVAAVFLVAAVVFLSLRTSDYLAVDGALRAVQVYDADRPFLHPNNHLLYPMNVYVWKVLAASVGFRARDAVEFMSLAQAMNAVAAAGVLAILYGLVRRATSSIGLACLTVIGYGLSRAFSVHATNSAEAMVGLFWSACAVALCASRSARLRRGRWLLGGVVLALAMATYQSMVLVGPSILVLLAAGVREPVLERWWRGVVHSVSWFLAGAAIGTALTFGTAYYLSGTRDTGAMIERFGHVASADIYWASIGLKMAAFLPGLAYALFPCLPRECGGFRCLLTPEYRAWIPVAVMATVVAAGWVAGLVVATARSWRRVGAQGRLNIIAGTVAFVGASTPIITWLPSYDKLWLEPLACLFVTSALVMGALSGELARPWRRWLTAYLSALVAVAGVWNVARMVEGHVNPTPYLEQARRVANVVGPRDVLVGDWNEIFLLYQGLWGSRGNVFNVPTEAELSGPEVMNRLSEALARTRNSGGDVFFLGILDVPMRDWHTVLGMRRLHYEDFEPYRCCSETLMRFPYRKSEISLRRLSPSVATDDRTGGNATGAAHGHEARESSRTR